MAEKKPPFEGKLIYLGGDSGRWIAGLPPRDITADEFADEGYLEKGNFTLDQLVSGSSPLYEIKPPRTSPKKDAGKSESGQPSPAPESDNKDEPSKEDKK